MCEYLEVKDQECSPICSENEIFNQNGDLRPGVQVVDAESGKVIEEGEVKFPSSKFPPGHPLFFGDDIRGDYHEFRDLLLQGTRHAILKAAVLLPHKKLALLREHCWHIASYFEKWQYPCLFVGLILTRVLVGDTEYDLTQPDDPIMLEEDESMTEEVEATKT